MENLRVKFSTIGFCLVLAVLGQSAAVYCNLTANKVAALDVSVSAGLVKKSPNLVFGGVEQKILNSCASLIKNFSGVVPQILEHYRALHASLHEVAKLQVQQTKGLPLVGAEESKELESAKNKEFETAKEHAMCQEIIAKLRRNLGPKLFKTVHANSSKLHSVIHKIIHARFEPDLPDFQSKCMAFLKMPSDKIEQRIEDFFAEIKTFGLLSQFLSELVAVLDGMRTHLPDGDKILAQLVPPSPADLVNQAEKHLHKAAKAK